MEPLPPPKFQRGRFNRKRRRDNSNGEGNDSEGETEPCKFIKLTHFERQLHNLFLGGDGKKDKKEEGEEKMDTEKVAADGAAA